MLVWTRRRIIAMIDDQTRKQLYLHGAMMSRWWQALHFFWWKWSNQTRTEVRHLKDQSSLTEVSRTQSSIMISWLHLQEWPTSRQWRTIPDPTELLTQPLTQVFISWSRAEPLRPHSPWRASVWPSPSAERWGLMSRWRGLVIRLERQVGWGTWLIGNITY